MKTNQKGIPCNEITFTPKAKRDRVIYQFVSDDGNTPSRCTVQIGDIDPISGEAITDLEFFYEYHRQADKEIHRTLANLRPEYTKEQQARRKAEADTYQAEFEEEHGYAPSRDDVRYHLQALEQERLI